MQRILSITIATALLSFQFAANAQNWLTTGNSNITTSKFLGTTNNQPVIIKTNNAERMRVLGNGNIGIGTATPENKFHIFKGSAGSVTGWMDAPLVVENSVNSYIQLLAPEANASGILFGKPSSNLSGGIFYNDVSHNKNGFDFRTNGNVTQMVLNDAGNLGVGTETPGSKFVVTDKRDIATAVIQNLLNGSDGSSIADGLYIQAGLNNSIGSYYVLFKKPNGVYVGAISHASLNSVAYNTSSDKRLKTNIRETKFGLAAVNKIAVKDYNFIGDKEEQTGFIAQQLYEVFPEAVAKGGDDPKTRPWMVDYGRVTPLLVKAIQELSKENEELKKKAEKIDALEKDNAAIKEELMQALKDRIAKLETIIQIPADKTGTPNASLQQNQPNPFNKSTIIRYSIPQGSKGQINIYDQTGKLVKTLTTNDSGQSELNGNDLGSGTYTYTLMVNGKISLSKQMLVIK